MSRSTATPAAPQTSKAAHATATAPQQSCATTQGCSPEKVAARAYQKWLQKGCKHGNDRQDWLEAEAELKAELARTGKK